jgi:hypothetical protein
MSSFTSIVTAGRFVVACHVELTHGAAWRDFDGLQIHAAVLETGRLQVIFVDHQDHFESRKIMRSGFDAIQAAAQLTRPLTRRQNQ